MGIAQRSGASATPSEKMARLPTLAVNRRSGESFQCLLPYARPPSALPADTMASNHPV